MQYLLLLVLLVVSSPQNILMKQYTKRTPKPNQFLFLAVSSIAAMMFFCVSAGKDFALSWEFVPYSIATAIAYAAALIGLNLAIQTGPLAITSLVMSYSLIIPTLYGIVMLKETIGITAYVGIILLIISLYFINVKKEAVKFSAKWIFYLVIGFVANGTCSVIQKMQQIRFEGAYRSEFMVVALALVFLMFVTIEVCKKTNLKTDLKACGGYAALYGISNGATNLLVLIMTGLIPNAILFPSISAGTSIVMFLVSTFIYKEKLSKLQMLGYAIGVVSIICLNI